MLWKVIAPWWRDFCKFTPVACTVSTWWCGQCHPASPIGSLTSKWLDSEPTGAAEWWVLFFHIDFFFNFFHFVFTSRPNTCPPLSYTHRPPPPPTPTSIDTYHRLLFFDEKKWFCLFLEPQVSHLNTLLFSWKPEQDLRLMFFTKPPPPSFKGTLAQAAATTRFWRANEEWPINRGGGSEWGVDYWPISNFSVLRPQTSYKTPQKTHQTPQISHWPLASPSNITKGQKMVTFFTIYAGESAKGDGTRNANALSTASLKPLTASYDAGMAQKRNFHFGSKGKKKHKKIKPHGNKINLNAGIARRFVGRFNLWDPLIGFSTSRPVCAT